MNIGRQVSLHGDFYEPIRHAAQDMGFHNIQLLMWHPSEYTQENADMILKACKDFDVKVSALWCGWTGPRDFGYPGMFHTIGLVPVAWRAQRTNELLAGAEFARKIGVQDIVTHVGFMSDNPFDEDRMGVMHAIRHICKTIAPFGQRFLFETGEMIATTLTQLIKDINVENIGINFDCANMIINCRGNSADALRILAPLVRGVHIKDAVPPVGMDPKGKEVKAGEGTANFPELIRILKEAGYDGDLTIEREISDKVQRDIDVMDTKAFLEKLL
ncbi:MAG: sugar phosphate isomerase/epimerase [Oscillospiraceae bacterium]|nr:sugar phosphate isomerase/epimerase [Oscillospiraceae bacterium]